jgi:L-lactate dehydrogenase complex protein LldE
MPETSSGPHVAKFVTCLVELFRPVVGFAAVKLLEEAGCRVSVPLPQTCCGQPAYNSGARAEAASIARQVLQTFRGYDYVVAPSGSCAGMLKKHYPALFAEGDPLAGEARAFAARVHELTSFLADVLHVDFTGRAFHGSVTYHDSCSSLRELKVKSQPRRLLESLDGLTLNEMDDCEVCCGFGGLFSVKYPDISNAMVAQKAQRAEETKAQVLTGADLGCLMNIAGKLSRGGRRIEVRHVAEILAGLTGEPGL